MSPPQAHFVALEPDAAFRDLVSAYKKRAAARVGDQLYLGDPPHLTLYLALFAPDADLIGAVGEAARGLAVPRAEIAGWHVFEADPLTGHNTLACDVAAEGRQALADVQQRVVGALAPLRDAPATRARYQDAWDRLSGQERSNVDAYGFPFVGTIWRPHLSIASIRPADWAGVWSALGDDPPSGLVTFPCLTVNRLDGLRPVMLERFRLQKVGT